MNKPEPGDLLFADLTSEQISRLKDAEHELNSHKSERDEIILLAFNKLD